MATRWACLGTGCIASDFFKTIRENLPEDEHKFVAVSSRSLERAQHFAKQFKFIRAYGSHESVATDSDVDVVYICTINRDHFPLSIKMLRAGKHVLCEKPMALNEKQVREVFRVAREEKRFFSEGLWSRSLPLYDVIRQELKKDNLGEIRFVRANLTALIGDRMTYASLPYCGGAALCVGIYTIQFATLVFNEMPEKIVAVGNMASTGVDEKAAVILQYKNGAIANLTFGMNAVTEDCTATILGSKAHISVGSHFFAPDIVRTPSGVFERPTKDSNYNFPKSEALYFEVDVVRNTIIKGELENENWTMEDTLLLYRIMDEIRRQLGLRYPDEDQLNV